MTAGDERKYWAALVPEQHWRSDHPNSTFVRWLVICQLPGERGGWLLYQPDEAAGAVWDNWFATREDVDEAALLSGVRPGDWEQIRDLGQWPAGPGWPPPEWLPGRLTNPEP
jgi:hypothetical protein